jgi:hypothetical protein
MTPNSCAARASLVLLRGIQAVGSSCQPDISSLDWENWEQATSLISEVIMMLGLDDDEEEDVDILVVNI